MSQSSGNDSERSGIEPLNNVKRPSGGRALRRRAFKKGVAGRAGGVCGSEPSAGRARGACPSHEDSFSRGARGACPSHEDSFSRGARGARPSHEDSFSRGARGARPSLDIVWGLPHGFAAPYHHARQPPLCFRDLIRGSLVRIGRHQRRFGVRCGGAAAGSACRQPPQSRPRPSGRPRTRSSAQTA